ncbi:MAG: hypothetical protein Q4G28_08330 [Neisseria sp.]|nr:hypothetical protein [Neisseria sp.]
MNIPFNKFTLLALAWFAGGTYALLFREADGGVPPFPHFDKVAHFALFFGQIWLIAKAYLAEKRAIPYRSLLVLALLVAAGSEVAQAVLTRTREGSWLDGAADLLGACAALWLAHQVAQARRRSDGL